MFEGAIMTRYGKASRCARYGLATILLIGAPVVSVASEVTRYLIVSGDNSSGSWDSRDEPRFKEWRTEYGAHYAWFRQDGRDYIVTDSHTLAECEAALAPQRDVNRRQAEVNRHQEDVNHLQAGVNSHQSEVNRAQADVNRQQGLANDGSAAQSHVNQMQSEVNGKQQAVNSEQDKVNQRQSAVNKEQEEVNRMQTRASAEIDKALRTIFDSARHRGLAREAR
jgi:phage terminase large subunit-like protein